MWTLLVLWNPVAFASPSPYFDVSVLGDGYFMPSAQKYNNGQLHARIKLLNQNDHVTSFFDFGAGGLVGDKAESYFILPQFYISHKDEKTIVTLGRHVRSYSTLDEYWMLGDVQPVFRWDTIHPEQQGLTGLFIDHQITKNLEVSLFGSYTFIPTQGASYSIVDGKLTSSNPWFSRPVDILNVQGDPFDLKYAIKAPDVSDVVFRPSWGLGFTLKNDNDSLWMRANYFEKAKNDLALPFDGALNYGANTGDITVFPQAAKHHLTTLDLGYRGDKFGATLSGIYEADTTFKVDDPPWIYPVYSDQYKVGLNLMAHLTAAHTVEFGALRTFKNSVSVRGLPGTTELDIFTYRNQYDNAVDLRWSSVAGPRSYGFLFKTKVRYAYDYEASTSLASFEVNCMPVEGFSVFALSDFFGGKREAGKVYNNLLVNYLNRDRAQAGVRFVF